MQILLGLVLVAFVGIMAVRLFRKSSAQLATARKGPAAWATSAPALGLEVPQPGKLYLQGNRNGRAVTLIGDRIEDAIPLFDITAPSSGDPHRRMKSFWTRAEIAFATPLGDRPDLTTQPSDIEALVTEIKLSGGNLRATSTGLILMRPGISEEAAALEADIAMLSALAERLEGAG